MVDKGRYPILGVNISAIDYEAAVDRITKASRQKTPFAVTALAVHGVMTGFLDSEHRKRLNGLDMITPDGQPVRWALNWKHGVKLDDRVYGPNLTINVIKTFAKEGIPVYFYGSKEPVLENLKLRLKEKYPDLIIAGTEPSKFRKLNSDEKKDVIERINRSGAGVVFVGLGCPRQEVWVYEYRNMLPMPILAVGAAFDFHAGTLDQAPSWMQKRGLEWFYRLIKEPKRLFKRYIVLNPLYMFYLTLEITGLKSYKPLQPNDSIQEISYG